MSDDGTNELDRVLVVGFRGLHLDFGEVERVSVKAEDEAKRRGI